MAIKIPSFRLSIERVERDEGRGLGAEAVGVGMVVFCMLTVLLGNSAGLADGALGALRTAFCIANMAALLVCSACDTRVHTAFRRLRLAAACSVGCLAAGASLFGAAALAGPAAAAVAACAGAVLGACTAMLVFYWGIAYARMETPDIVLSTAVSTAVGFVLYALCPLAVPRPALHAVACVVPLANAFLLRNRVTERLPEPERTALYFSELAVKRPSFALKTVPALAALGLVAGLLLVHTQSNPVPAGLPAFVALTAAAAVFCIAVSLAARAYIRRRDVSFAQVFRMLMPLAAALALPVPFVQPDTLSAVELCVLADLILCASVAWAFLASLSQEYRLSPVFVFGLGFGSAAAGMLAAVLLAPPVAAATADVLPFPALVLALCLFALVVVSAFFPRAVDIHAIVSQSFAPDELRGDASLGEGLPYGAHDEDDGAGAHAGGAGRGGSGTAEGAGAPEGRAADGGAPRKGRFVRRCERVADTYLLSRRELDVLVLLAKGRNVGFIKEQLCISEGTAKTHVHHVYKKLNIHSQQELIELVDSMDVG